MREAGHQPHSVPISLSLSLVSILFLFSSFSIHPPSLPLAFSLFLSLFSCSLLPLSLAHFLKHLLFFSLCSSWAHIHTHSTRPKRTPTPSQSMFCRDRGCYGDRTQGASYYWITRSEVTLKREREKAERKRAGPCCIHSLTKYERQTHGGVFQPASG